MPDRIRTYLDKMDKLRDEIDIKTDEMLKKINIKTLMVNPEKNFKLIVLKFLKDNNSLFKQAKIEGEKLAERLK